MQTKRFADKSVITIDELIEHCDEDLDEIEGVVGEIIGDIDCAESCEATSDYIDNIEAAHQKARQLVTQLEALSVKAKNARVSR